MRRAIPVLALLLPAALLLPRTAHEEARPVTSINGIGLIDYHDRPDLKAGTWVKYHVSGHSQMGMSDDYTVTVAIGGEERFWGEDCFWVETITEPVGRPAASIATLMSYAIFSDTLAFPHMQYYIRKTCSDINELGQPVEVVAKRPAESLVKRDRKESNIRWYIDTLGTDTARVQRGLFNCRKVQINQAVGASVDQGDTTIYTEVREVRHTFVSDRVPITHIVREEIDYSIRRKKWLIGRSQDAPENIMERSTGSAELVDFGTDYKPILVRPAVQKTQAEQDRAARRAVTPARPRPTTRKPG